MDALLDKVTSHPPRLVIFRPDDKYNNEHSERVMAFVREKYDHIDARNGVVIYRLR